jgi:TPR repeat protein
MADLSTIRVLQNERTPPGEAIIRVTGVERAPLDERFEVRRADDEGSSIGSDWPAGLRDPVASNWDPQTQTWEMTIGPDVVNPILGGTKVAISLPGISRQEMLSWPDNLLLAVQQGRRWGRPTRPVVAASAAPARSVPSGEQNRQAQAEQQRREEEQRRQAQAEQQRREEEQRRQAQAEQLRREEEQRRQAQAEQQRREEEQRRQVQAEQQRREEEQRRQAQAEQQRREEEQRRQAQAEQQRREEEQRSQAQAEQQGRDEEQRRQAQAEQQRREEDRRRDEEKKKREAEEQRREEGQKPEPTPAKPSKRKFVLASVLGACIGALIGVAGAEFVHLEGASSTVRDPTEAIRVPPPLPISPDLTAALIVKALTVPPASPSKTSAAGLSLTEIQNRALSYHQGSNGVKRDDAEALYWAKHAARGGLYLSILGQMYFEGGEGVQPDPQLAELFWQLAAISGSSVAMQNLGNFYEKSDAPDAKANAIFWYQRAAKSADPRVQENARQALARLSAP